MLAGRKEYQRVAEVRHGLGRYERKEDVGGVVAAAVAPAWEGRRWTRFFRERSQCEGGGRTGARQIQKDDQPLARRVPKGWWTPSHSVILEPTDVACRARASVGRFAAPHAGEALPFSAFFVPLLAGHIRTEFNIATRRLLFDIVSFPK